MKTNHAKQERVEAMIGARVPVWVRKFYERRALRERRRLSDVVRIVLTDYAAAKRGTGAKQ